MSKRFDIRLGLEEILEVDKVSDEMQDKKEAPESEKVLDAVVAAAEKPEETPEPAEQSGDAPVEVSEDKTTVDGTPVEEETSTADKASEDEAKTDEDSKEEEPVSEEKPEETKSEDAKEDDESIEDDTQPEVDESKESSLSDVADALKEDENNDDEVEVATEAAITLEEIAEQLEASLDQGGMSENAAAVTDIALRRICNTVGIVPKESEEIAVESFKSPSKRVRQTKVAIETIGGYVSKIWDAFIAAVKRGIDWIKEFVANIFNDYARFKKQIDTLAEAVKKLPDDKVDLTGKEFKEQSVIDNLKIKQTVDATDAIDKLFSFTHLYYSLIKKQKEKQINNLKDIIDSVIKGTILPSAIEVQPIESFDIVKGRLPGYNAPQNTQPYLSNHILPGNKRFIAFYPPDNLHLDVEADVVKYHQAMNSSVFSFVVDIENNKKEVTSAPVLDKAELLKIVSNLKALCKEALDSKPIFDSFIKEKTIIHSKLETLIKEENHKSKLTQISDKISEVAGRKKEVSQNSIFEPIKAHFTLFKKTYESGSSQLSALIHKTIKSGITYANFCIKENLILLSSKTP